MIRINLRKFYCQCGCNKEIRLKPYYVYYGIPKYIYGHNRKGKKSPIKGKSKYPNIDLNQFIYCKCGCNQRIFLKVRHMYDGIPKFISGHSSRDAFIKNKMNSKDKGKKISKQLQGHAVSEETKNKIRKKRVGKKQSIQTKEKLRQINKGNQYRKNIPHTEITKEKIRKSTKALWQNPEYRENLIKKWMKSNKIKPNKPELKLYNILNELYPNEFKYVGDGEVIIAGKCPDFININGKKQVIELFGDYWHRNDNPEDRMKIFEPYGYKTLVIWERELKDVNKVKEKLKEFII